MPTDQSEALKGLLDRGAFVEAVQIARQWLAAGPDDPAVLLNAGAVFIDAGRHLGQELVREGVGLTERGLALAPDSNLKLAATYNLANSLLQLHDMEGGAKYTDVVFEPDLQRLASLYYEVIDSDQRLTREAWLNFTSVLQRQSRAARAATPSRVSPICTCRCPRCRVAWRRRWLLFALLEVARRVVPRRGYGGAP